MGDAYAVESMGGLVMWEFYHQARAYVWGWKHTESSEELNTKVA